MMYAIDPTMSFAQVVQYYKDYVKRTKSCGRKPVSLSLIHISEPTRPY